MYLVHCVDTARSSVYHDYTGVLFTFRIELSATGVAVWAKHSQRQAGRGYNVDAARGTAKSTRLDKRIPFVEVSHGRPVTPSQAMRLTGMTLGAAALDYITGRLQDGLDGPGTELSNYVNPPKPKKPKPEPEPKAEPTPLDRASKRLAFADEKVAEWLAAVRHAEAKLKEWRRKAKARRRRTEQLSEVEAGDLV